MKKLVFCVMLLWLPIAAMPQNPSIEALKATLHSAKGDTAKASALSNLSFELMSYGNLDEAMVFAKQEEILCKKMNYKRGIADAYALFGTIWFERGRYPDALKNYLTSLSISESINDSVRIADALENIALVYFMEENYEASLQKHFIALEIFKKHGAMQGIASTLVNMGSIYAIQKKYADALKSFFDALQIMKKGKDKHGELMLLANIGSLYGDMKNFPEANKYFEQGLIAAKEIDDKSTISNIYNSLGNMSLLQHRNQEAITYFNKALVVSKEIQSVNGMKDGYKGLADAYSEMHQPEKALDSYKNYILYRDSLFNEENTRKSVQVQMQYDFDKKESATKAQQEIKEASAREEIQKQKTLKVAVFLGSALLILVLLFIFQRRKTKHQIQVNKLENKTLRSQLNPHFIFNALGSIQRYMNEHPEQAQNYLAKFGKLMREVLENSEREYISLEDEIGMLKKYMDLEALRVKDGFEYEFIISPSIDQETVQLPPLIFQPVIENAIWHGVAIGDGKGKISVKIGLNNNSLNVEVENSRNGETLAQPTAKEENGKDKSFGLQIVRERLVLLSNEKKRKAALELIPGPSGMKVHLEIPV